VKSLIAGLLLSTAGWLVKAPPAHLSRQGRTASDTLRIKPAVRPPAFDGQADSIEWGTPSLRIRKPGGEVLVWLRRSGGSVFLAAQIPDSTFYWGDDLVVSIDTRGDRARSPQHDDFQWCFRRVLDSSVVYRGNDGRWMEPLGDPDWRLRQEREGGGWEVRSVSTGSGWSLELRLDPEWFAGEGGSSPGLALRTYDDGPNRRFIWPDAPGLTQSTQLERRPDLWAVVTAAP